MAITASNFDNWVYASNFGLDDVTDIVANATTVTITTSAGYTVTLTGKFSNTGGAPEDITGTITQIAWTDADLGSDDNTIAGLKVDAAQLVNLVVTSEGLGWDSEDFEDRLNSLIYKGNDHIVGDAAHYNYIFGGAGNDKLVGGDAGNTIRAFDGNDTITGGDGEDHVYTGNGNSKITTDGGEDYVEVGNGNNKINVGDGNNDVFAGDGNNKIVSGVDDDRIYVGDGNNNIDSGDGYSWIYAGDGNNKIVTGDGTDDNVIVGSGNNTIDLGDGYNDFWTHTVRTEDLGTSVVDSLTGNTLVTWGEDEIYGGGNNKITGGNDTDYLWIGGGNNVVKAGDGYNYIVTESSYSWMYSQEYDSENILIGNSYQETTTFGSGNNKITGGDDTDQIIVGAGNNVVNLGDGFVNSLMALDAVTYGEDFLNSTETWNYQFGDGNNKITGGDGEDYIIVGSGNNVIKLGDARDGEYHGYNSVYAVDSAEFTYSGEDTDFSISFGDGNNKITGGKDNDFVVVGNGDNVIKLGDGMNVVYALDSIEGTAYGNIGNYGLYGYGNNFSYLINSADDTNFSDGGNNKITGGNDSDYVFVGSGNDNIQLGKGADGVDAGAGSNKIDLGKDTDVDWVDFNYNDFLTAAAEGDTAFNKVTNFGAEDQLWFELDIDTSQVLIQKGKIDLSNASNDGYVLALDTSSGKLYYDADGSGSAEQFVQIGLIQGAGVKGLTSANVFDDGDWIAIGNVSFV